MGQGELRSPTDRSATDNSLVQPREYRVSIGVTAHFLGTTPSLSFFYSDCIDHAQGVEHALDVAERDAGPNRADHSQTEEPRTLPCLVPEALVRQRWPGTLSPEHPTPMACRCHGQGKSEFNGERSPCLLAHSVNHASRVNLHPA